MDFFSLLGNHLLCFALWIENYDGLRTLPPVPSFLDRHFILLLPLWISIAQERNSSKKKKIFFGTREKI